MLMGTIFGLFAELCLRGVGVSRRKIDPKEKEKDKLSKENKKKSKNRKKVKSFVKSKTIVAHGNQKNFAKAIVKKTK